MFLFQIKLSYYDLILINAVIGFLLGLIPLLLGFFKKKIKFGVFGIIGSTIGGTILGLFLAIPITIVFTWLIVKKETVSESGENVTENSENN